MKYFEDNNHELKRELNSSVKKEIVSFLNTKGGTIYVGVDDDGKVFPFTDNKVRDEIDTQLGNWIQDSFYPDITSLIKYSFNKDNVMVIEVLEGLNKPYYLKEKGPKPSGVYKRVGRSARQASEDEILSMIMSSKDFYYEKEVSDEQDLSFKKFNQICEENNVAHDIRSYKSLNMINSDGQYTNLGLLMSDQSPIEVKFAKYDKNMNFIVKKIYSGSLVKILEDVLEHSSGYNDVSAIIDGKSFKRIETMSYPGASLREGILNAFCHADYFIRSNIKIEFYDDKVKITNPGGIFKASLEDILGGIQTYRNPGLVKILNKLGYIENFGTGIPRILEAYSNSIKKPEFKPTENFFVLVLPNMNDPVKYPVNDLVTFQINDPSNYYYVNLNDRDLLILKIIKENPGLRVPEILSRAKKYDASINEDKIKNSLKRKLNNYVEFKGAPKNGGYYLKNN